MYLGEEKIIPTVVFMWYPHLHMKQSQSRASSDKAVTDNTAKIDIYLCQACHSTSSIQLNSVSGYLLEILKNKSIGNRFITKNIERLVRPAQGFTVPPTEISVEISKGGTINIMKVCEYGIRDARLALRNVGVLPGQECPIVMIITQNDCYSLQMRLYAGKLSLCLYEMEDILHHISDMESLVPIFVLSTCCHRLDPLVEETYSLKSEDIPDNTHGNKPDDEHDHKLPMFRVKGMKAVMKSLLKQSIVAATVRSMGSDYDITYSKNIHKDEIVKALCALNLTSDNENEAQKFNEKYNVEIIKPAHSTFVLQNEGTVSISDECVPGSSNISIFPVDYRFQNLDALSHSIYHQNTSSLSHVHKCHGMDVQELSTAMYSRIAFCHSLKYKDAISTQNVQVINTTDFPGEFSHKIKEIIKSDAAKLSAAKEHWSPLRHNFHECNGTDVRKRKDSIIATTFTGLGSIPLLIQFHITENGLIFFRKGEDIRGNFVGVVYVAPCVYRLHVNMADLTSFNEQDPTSPKQQDPTPFKEQKTTFNEIIKVIHQLNNEHLDSKQALMRNATMLLFFLNVICVNNFLHKKAKNMRCLEHQMLRKAWLCSYRIKASVLCGGVASEEFCSIFAHFANLASLPYDSVGYWSTVPYV